MANRGAGGPNIGASDIVPGVVAAAGFVALAFGLQLPLILAAALSAGGYFGLRLLMPPPKAENFSRPTDLRSVVATAARESAPLTPHLREKSLAVCELSERLLHIAESNPAQATDIYLAVAEYINVLRQGLTLYRDRAAATTSGPQTRAALERMLDSVYQRLDSLRDSIVREDDSQTAREMNTLNQTVSDMDEVLLQVQGKGRNG